MRVLWLTWRAARPGRSVAVALCGLAAEGMARVGAEDLDLAREEAELVERQPHRSVVGMPLDIGIELRRREASAEHVALELGHVDAVGGEAAQCLVERRRHVAHAK